METSSDWTALLPENCWKKVGEYLDEESLVGLEESSSALDATTLWLDQWEFLDQHRGDRKSCFGSTPRERGHRYAVCSKRANELEEKEDSLALTKKRKHPNSNIIKSDGCYTKTELLEDFGLFLEQGEDSRVSPNNLEFFLRLTYKIESARSASSITLQEGFLSNFCMEDDDHPPNEPYIEIHELGILTAYLGRHTNVLGSKERTGIDETATFDRDSKQPWPEAARKQMLDRLVLTILAVRPGKLSPSLPPKLVVTTRGFGSSQGRNATMTPMSLCSEGGGDGDDDDDDEVEEEVVNVAFSLWQKHSFSIEVKILGYDDYC